jgi:hypothetical protein
MSSGEPNAKRIKFNSAVGKVCDRGTKKVWYLPLLTVCKDISSGGDMEPSRVPGDFMYEDPWKAYRAIVIESFALLYSEFAPSSFELTPVQFADEALVIIDEYEDSDMSPERSDCESDCDSGSERCTHCSRTNCDCANESDSSCQGLRQRLKKVKMNREDDESSLNTWRSIFVAIEAELYEADGGYCMNVFEIEDHYADVSASYTLVATAESGDGVHKHRHYLGPYLTDNMDQVRFAVLSAVLMQTFAFIKDEFERDNMQDHMMHLAAWNATSKNEGFDFKQAFEDLRDWIRRLHKERLADGDANVADVLEKLHTAAHADIILFEYLKQLIGFLKRIQEIDSRDIYNLSYQVTILNVKLAPTTAANTGVVPIRRDQPSECKREEILNETNGAYVTMFSIPSMFDSGIWPQSHLDSTLAWTRGLRGTAILKPCAKPGVVDVVRHVSELTDTTIFAVGPMMTRQNMDRLLQTTSYNGFKNESDAQIRVRAIAHEPLNKLLLLEAERGLTKNGLDVLQLITSYLGNSEQWHFILCAPNTALQTRLGRHEARRMAATFRRLFTYFIGGSGKTPNRSGNSDSPLAPRQDPPRYHYRHENADYTLSLFDWQKISLTTLLDFQHQRTRPAGMDWHRPLTGLVDEVRFNDRGDIDCAAHRSPDRKVEWHHKSALLVAPTGAGKSVVIFGYLFETIQNVRAEQSREGYLEYDHEGRLRLHTGVLIVPSQIIKQFQDLFSKHWPECKIATLVDQKTAKNIPSFHDRSQRPDLVIISSKTLMNSELRAALVPIEADLQTAWTQQEWPEFTFSCTVFDEAHETLGSCKRVRDDDPRTLYLDPKAALLRYLLRSAFTVSVTATPQLETVESVARYLCMNQLVEYTTVASHGEQSRLVLTEPCTQQEATRYGSRAFPTNNFKDTQAALKVSVSGTSFLEVVNDFLAKQVLIVADAALRPLSRLSISHYSSRVEHAAVQYNRFQKYLEKHIRGYEIVSHQDIWTTFMASEEVIYAQKIATNDAKRAALEVDLMNGYQRRILDQEIRDMKQAINNLRNAFALDKAHGNLFLFDGPTDHPFVQKLNANAQKQRFKKKNGMTYSEYMLGSLLHWLVVHERKKVLLYMEPRENPTLDLSFLATTLKAAQVPVVVYRGTCKALENKINQIQMGPSVAILSGNNVSGVNMPFMDIMVIYGKTTNEAALVQARGRVNRACCHVNRPDGSCCETQKCTELWVNNSEPVVLHRGTKRDHGES